MNTTSYNTYSISKFTLVIIIVFISLNFTISFASPPRPFNKVYVFGDSYTDTGNNNDSTGPAVFRHISKLPYGKKFFHQATNRYSDVRIFIDYIGAHYIAGSLNSPYFPPYLNKSADTTHGVNFAVGGCTAIPYSYFVKINATLNTVPQSLLTQLSWFNDHINGSGCKDAVSTPKKCKAVFESALVWLGEISANDYNIQNLAIYYQIKFLEEMLKMGAKHVVVQGLSTTGCFPVAFAMRPLPTDRDEIGCVTSKNKESFDHNMRFQENLNSLRKKFPDTKIVYGDDWHAYRELYRNPQKYGFIERFRFQTCCGLRGAPHGLDFMRTCGAEGTISCKHPSRYMSWDGLHVTQGLSKKVSDLFIGGSFAQPSFPYLLKKAAESKA